MTTLPRTRTHPAASSPRTLTTAVLVAVTWIGGAVLVAAAHTWLDNLSVSGGAVATSASIAAIAFVYMRVCAPQATISHALGVGIAWLSLAIVTEMVVVTQTGAPWYGLLGSPERPLLRNCFLFVWIFAPAFFARNADADEERRSE